MDVATEVVCVCPTLERQDLVQVLVRSFQDALPAPASRPPLTIVSSGRDDGTEGWCRNQGLEVIRHDEPLTFAQAVNLGAISAFSTHPSAKWLTLLNNDLTLQPGFWEALQEMDAAHYDIVGAKLLYPPPADAPPDTVLKIQHFGKWFSLDFYPFHVLRYQPSDHPMAQDIRPFPDVTFACAAIRREVWEHLNGLDEGYSNGFEDDDFSLRAREQGAQIGVHPKMLAIHRESQTSGMDNENKERQWLRFRQTWVDSGRIQWATGIWQGWKFV